MKRDPNNDAGRPPRVLMVDIGGSNVKVMVNSGPEMRKFPSGPKLKPMEMVEGVAAITSDWNYEVVTIGFPGLVRSGRLAREPLNLGGGWLEFDFTKAFGKPVRIINDAALQALANYRGGRMFFIGLGTSIGAAVVADGVVVPVEVGLVPLGRHGMFMSRLTKEARRAHGTARWEKDAHKAIALLQDIFWPRDTVIGGGNAKYLENLPANCRRTDNRKAIRGAVRVWEGADVFAFPHGTTWRIVRTPKDGWSSNGQAAMEDRTFARQKVGSMRPKPSSLRR